jgi:hypothetical protein
MDETLSILFFNLGVGHGYHLQMLQHLYPVEGHENMFFDHKFKGRLNSPNGLGIAEMQPYDPMLSGFSIGPFPHDTCNAK